MQRHPWCHPLLPMGRRRRGSPRGSGSNCVPCLVTSNTARSRLPATIARKQARCKKPSSLGIARRSRPYASHTCHGRACDAIASNVCPFSCQSAHVRTLLSGRTKRGAHPDVDHTRDHTVIRQHPWRHASSPWCLRPGYRDIDVSATRWWMRETAYGLSGSIVGRTPTPLRAHT